MWSVGLTLFSAVVAQALQCLDRARVDVAVVDYLLGDSNSEPLQAALKQRHIPFVVVSSYPRALVPGVTIH